MGGQPFVDVVKTKAQPFFNDIKNQAIVILQLEIWNENTNSRIRINSMRSYSFQ